MKNAFLTVLAVVILNFFIVSYEFQGSGRGWKLYASLAFILLLSAIALPIGIVLLIPITGYNLLVNTKRLFGFKKEE
ncbi:MAG: hypothetical protein DDT42_01110 [candidate division WS2 bacterium]|uniref:Uncharacterized protein n=1 Tax=Psychracetigena formicireducens TaxID=2986056 RepID=A0A9E2BJ49_PSYF1|nr:hypothetical protein [Candidatus Psychracetigena formicireducens]